MRAVPSVELLSQTISSDRQLSWSKTFIAARTEPRESARRAASLNAGMTTETVTSLYTSGHRCWCFVRCAGAPCTASTAPRTEHRAPSTEHRAAAPALSTKHQAPSTEHQG